MHEYPKWFLSLMFPHPNPVYVLWSTVGLCDIQLPHSNEDILCFSHLVVHCSSCREHEVKQVLEQNCALRANVVSFYVVCWLGVLSVIGRNDLWDVCVRA